eukprot:15470037-Alexandrium_andersonii.AAC.1
MSGEFWKGSGSGEGLRRGFESCGDLLGLVEGCGELWKAETLKEESTEKITCSTTKDKKEKLKNSGAGPSGGDLVKVELSPL